MRCSKCKTDKLVSEFDKNQSWCKTCNSLYGKERRKRLQKLGLCTHCGKEAPAAVTQCKRCADQNRKARYKIKQNIIDHYGGKCNHCGESHIEFLCIDHINNDGQEHRKQFICGGGKEIYLWLKKNDYPQGFQILCWNCNIEKAKTNLPSRFKNTEPTGIMQICCRCKQEKDSSGFNQRPSRGRTQYHCKICEAQEHQRYKERNKEIVFNHYGSECACCGEQNRNVLTVDHINDDGAEHRRNEKISDIYGWLVRNNLPEGFQILCMNCNASKQNFKYCPHQTKD